MRINEKGNYIKDRLELFKFRIVAMVICVTWLTYIWKVDVVEWYKLGMLLLGSAFISASGLALNNILEIKYDKLMLRTQGRPLVKCRIQKKEAFFWVIGLGVLAIGIFYIGFSMSLFILVLLSWLGYAFVYTPLKRRTEWNTIVGAIVGAMPPIWASFAVDNHLSWWGVSAFLLMFIWQMPHFYAIVWLYKEQYKKAGFVMFSMNDSQGYELWKHINFWLIALMFVTMIPFIGGLTHWGSLFIIQMVTIFYIIMAYRAYDFKERKLTEKGAKNILIGSFIYLPLWFLLMIGGRI